MLRTTTLSVAALLGAALLTPTTATAAGETCHGQPATIVGTERATPVVGTDGRDVIVVTGNARVVDARGGDDLVCVVDTFVRDLDAGPGDDVVDVSAGHGAWAELGTGADTYVGSPSQDRVWAGTRTSSGEAGEDTEVDVIDAGSTQESDEVYSGQRGAPNGDQVHVDVLASVTWAGTPTATSVLSSKRYSALTLELDASDRVLIDNVAQTVTYDGEVTAMPGFTQFTVTSPSGPRSLDFRGNDQGLEYLTLDLPRPREHHVDMGDGSNELTVSVGRPLAKGTRYRAGSGRDQIEVALVRGEVAMDLARGRLTTRLGRTATHARITGFAGASATATRAILLGTPQKDFLFASACHARLEGRAGGDTLGALTVEKPLRCPRRTFTALGGSGNDELLGATRPDTLIGGAGRDSADGRGGRDTCQAERRHSCEIVR